jgi:hypothetical protein
MGLTGQAACKAEFAQAAMLRWRGFEPFRNNEVSVVFISTLQPKKSITPKWVRKMR